MDPQSLSFTPQSDIWRLSNTMRNFQEVQQDHADRLLRLERRHDDDSRIKSVWGTGSPFPGVLSGTPATPQHGKPGTSVRSVWFDVTDLDSEPGPTNQSSGVDFTSFDDDQSNSMVRSLHLDAEEEPRRYGVGSRANSVRFDESAKQGQWGHTSRSSVDLPPRSSSGFGGFGGHPLFERTMSHKSDGRQSSAGQSAVSGRANSLMLESTNALGSGLLEPPGFAPGLFILGSVPSIIRCWLSTKFTHETLMYAAVCTGSYKSYLDVRMVDSLGLSGSIRQDLSGDRKVRVPVYLPEAVQQPVSSRSSSPATQLPSLIVEFTVMDRGSDHATSKAIQIIIGSDVLRAHNADVLFSTNCMTLFDDDRSKLSVPFVRPESDEAFKGLATNASPPNSRYRPNLLLDTNTHSEPLSNGIDKTQIHEDRPEAVEATPTTLETEQIPSPDSQPTGPEPARDEVMNGPSLDRGLDRKPSPAPSVAFKSDIKEASEESPLITASSRASSSPAIWGNWRRDAPNNNAGEWANGSRNATAGSQRANRDQGIKVLKPVRQVSRNTPTTPLPASPTVTGQSRFFDDGKRRSGPSSTVDMGEAQQQQQQVRRSASGETGRLVGKESGTTAGATTAAAVGNKLRGANPIGGASAFGWLNSGGFQK